MFVLPRILARRNNFRILPKHPLALEECQLYNYDEGFEMIDWDILTRVGQNDEDARQIKMAECLSPLVIPVDAFQCIYVSSKETENKVADMLKQKGVYLSTAIYYGDAPMV
ncbi:MAG: DarT ssDNA thymidine ADP-ribosyltransferase family protein [Ruminococcus sp.]